MKISWSQSKTNRIAKDHLWPEPFIQSPQIISNLITALRHIADGRPAVSRIGTNGQNRKFRKLNFIYTFWLTHDTPPLPTGSYRIIENYKKALNGSSEAGSGLYLKNGPS